jgi:nitrite reductase (NADH) small subunit
MDQLVRIAHVSQLPPIGELREFRIGDEPVCVANERGEYTALSGVCPHKGAPLAEGTIQNGKLVCPWHGWEFRLTNGQCPHHPGSPVDTFELIIQGEDVFLKF